MIALVAARRGELPDGAAEATAEAAGRALVVGEGAALAAAVLAARFATVAAPATPSAGDGEADEGGPAITYLELGPFRPGSWAPVLADRVQAEEVVVLPASPDGRDLAPRLASALSRPLYAAAVAVSADRVRLVRLGGRLIEDRRPAPAFVATLLPGSRAAPPPVAAADLPPAGEADEGEPAADAEPSPAPDAPVAAELGDEPDARLLELVEADPAAVDLAEAARIVAGGAGLFDRAGPAAGGADAFAVLAEVAAALGASVGATRVVTDAGLLPHERQIGTTGVSVHPRLYVAFGISGAAQHTGGIGDPEHLVAVNLDPSCPMMAMADLALVADARATLEALARRLAERPPAEELTGA